MHGTEIESTDHSVIMALTVTHVNEQTFATICAWPYAYVLVVAVAKHVTLTYIHIYIHHYIN